MTRADDDAVLDFYDRYTPQSGTGALDAALARLARGRRGEAEAGIVMAWLTLDLTEEEHAEFLSTFGGLLARHHDARLDMALWRGLDDVERMLPLASEGARRRAETRMRVAEAGPDGLDAAQMRDPGIAFALFEHHLPLGRGRRAPCCCARAGSAAGWESRTAGPAGGARWRGRRCATATRAWPTRSRRCISSARGAHYADLEWLAGYVALAISTRRIWRATISRGCAPPSARRSRSGGRATGWVVRWRRAARTPRGSPMPAGPRIRRAFTACSPRKRPVWMSRGRCRPPPRGALARGGVRASDLHEIGTLALRMNDDRLALRFFGRLAEMQDRQGIAQMGAMLDEIGTQYLQVRIGKAAAQRGLAVIAPYYPLHPMTAMDLPAPMEWALTIARRESEFRPEATSGAGARGLMQLMPATARAMARNTGLPWEPDRLNSDWQYNVRLGAAYLARLRARYDGNPLLMAAAYNAGPGRVADWLDRYGDPRLMDAEAVVDWIEHLPFSETRNYVMRVAESLPVYRARLGTAALPQPFSREISGRGAPVTE